MECTHCGSTSFKKNGMHKGVQRYQCNTCKQFFSDKVRKFSYHDKCRALDFYLNNIGVRKIAKFMKCSSTMIIRWIRDAAKRLKVQLDTSQCQNEIYTDIKKRLPGCCIDCLFSAKQKGYCVCDWRGNLNRAKDMQEIQEIYQMHIARLQQYQQFGISHSSIK
jgi:transposase-like protein